MDRVELAWGTEKEAETSHWVGEGKAKLRKAAGPGGICRKGLAVTLSCCTAPTNFTENRATKILPS